MAVYVDDMRRHATVGRIRSRWSHLFADTTEELQAFASQLGLQRSWLQHPGTHREHYDVTDQKRAQALRLGAVPLVYPHGTGRYINARKETDQ